MATSLLEAGSVDKAEECIERATRIDPCDPDISEILDRINAARESANRVRAEPGCRLASKAGCWSCGLMPDPTKLKLAKLTLNWSN